MKLSSITIYFSLVSTSLVIYGLTYNIFYYHKFNIEITSYIDISESLTLFLPSLPLILFFTTLTFMAVDTLLPSKIETNPISNHYFYGMLFDGLLLKKKTNLWIFGVVFLISLILLLLGEKSNTKLAGYGFALILSYLVLHFPLLLRLTYNFLVSKGISIPNSIPIIIYSSLFILICTLYAAELKKIRVLFSSRIPKTNIILKDGVNIETDTTVRYIGKTKNYIFLFDKNENSSRAIPMTEVKEILFINKF